MTIEEFKSVRASRTMAVGRFFDGPKHLFAGGLVYAPISVGQIVEESIFDNGRGNQYTRFSFVDDTDSRRNWQWNNSSSWTVRFWEITQVPEPTMADIHTIDENPPEGSKFMYAIGPCDAIWKTPVLYHNQNVTMRPIGETE